MREESDTPDAAMPRIAARQHGVITAAQLHEVGLDKSAISRRLKQGRLHCVHRGVYAVGHRGLSLHGRFMAAVLACGEGAVVSHSSAAVLWKLLYPLDGPVHISIPTTSGRIKRRGIHLHRCPSLSPPTEPSPSPSSLPIRGGRGRRLLVTYRDRIPVTTVPRTIEDLEGSIAPKLYHRGSVAFEADHARDLDLRAAGFTVLRFADRQLEEEPNRVVEDLRRHLACAA